MLLFFCYRVKFANIYGNFMKTKNQYLRPASHFQRKDIFQKICFYKERLLCR